MNNTELSRARLNEVLSDLKNRDPKIRPADIARQIVDVMGYNATFSDIKNRISDARTGRRNLTPDNADLFCRAINSLAYPFFDAIRVDWLLGKDDDKTIGDHMNVYLEKERKHTEALRRDTESAHLVVLAYAIQKMDYEHEYSKVVADLAIPKDRSLKLWKDEAQASPDSWSRRLCNTIRLEELADLFRNLDTYAAFLFREYIKTHNDGWKDTEVSTNVQWSTNEEEKDHGKNKDN